MENKENLVTEEVAENVEQTTEETPKLYTEEELNAKVNEITGKRLARREAKIRKEVESEYRDLIGTLEAGTGKKGAKELNDTFKEFYEKKGITINKKSDPEYSKKDIEVLAKAEADEIIDAGYEEVVEEVDRLTELGFDNMTAKDKAVFKKLAEYRQSAERSKELAKIGVPDDVYNSSEFKDFASMFNSNTPIAKVYETYAKTQPKKEFKTTGSMKSTNSADSDVKDYYTPEEARGFTKKELDNNPALFKAIENSMRRWKKK
jgi:hypothetical protein